MKKDFNWSTVIILLIAFSCIFYLLLTHRKQEDKIKQLNSRITDVEENTNESAYLLPQTQTKIGFRFNNEN